MARVAVVGAGAVGSVFAAQLAQAGRHELVVCARRPFARIEVDSPQVPANLLSDRPMFGGGGQQRGRGVNPFGRSR